MPTGRPLSRSVPIGAACLVLVLCGHAQEAAGQTSPPLSPPPIAPIAAPANDPARQALADLVGRIVEGAIPLEYEKQKDWGATKEIPVGVRVSGKFLHTHVNQRTKKVEHGVWKHYKLRIVEPEKNLVVRVTALRPIEPGRWGATIEIETKLDAWARAKVYQYGVHLISVEIEADARVKLVIDGELALLWNSAALLGELTIDPTATAARMELTEFRMRRVRDAKGPLVHELSGGVRSLIENELDGPHLTANVNRAIENKRGRLTLSGGDLLDGAWRPLAAFAGSSQTSEPATSAPPAPAQ